MGKGKTFRGGGGSLTLKPRCLSRTLLRSFKCHHHEREAQYEVEKETFIGRIRMCHEIWVHHYTLKSKRRSKECRQKGEDSSAAAKSQDEPCEMLLNALELPVYSPDLSPLDYFMFCLLKNTLGRRRFEIDQAVTVVSYERDPILPPDAIDLVFVLTLALKCWYYLPARESNPKAPIIALELEIEPTLCRLARGTVDLPRLGLEHLEHLVSVDLQQARGFYRETLDAELEAVDYYQKVQNIYKSLKQSVNTELTIQMTLHLSSNYNQLTSASDDDII
ncbi:hypothetical protein EVAR_28925_1 [Eumeta japonica]|uniref:Mariner Mos1 transposase n=1 Tax=Eumeta variegata TaxID=151549 RepID=A0A4C1YPH5_EUMVA|nr:hypothetical protein EVAR_28925_1 [Eumeta japonica]